MMVIRRKIVALALGALLSTAAFAQSTATEVERNVDQQQRIEQGLQSGALNTRAAAKLERAKRASTGWRAMRRRTVR